MLFFFVLVPGEMALKIRPHCWLVWYPEILRAKPTGNGAVGVVPDGALECSACHMRESTSSSLLLDFYRLYLRSGAQLTQTAFFFLFVCMSAFYCIWV